MFCFNHQLINFHIYTIGVGHDYVHTFNCSFNQETALCFNEVNETSGNIACVIDIVLWETLHFIMKILYIIRI